MGKFKRITEKQLLISKEIDILKSNIAECEYIIKEQNERKKELDELLREKRKEALNQTKIEIEKEYGIHF